ncbi:MAG: gliding motility-associated C-terminal domain-containing protein [Bacteroidetes bacterium]|nr:gliding motility-associated C-terminal domain-containing protein [Bacteroidota bacterium]
MRFFSLTILFVFSLQLNAGIKLIKNGGQWKDNILFKAGINGGFYFIERNTITYSFYDEAALDKAMHSHTPDMIIKRHVVKMEFVDANPNPTVISLLPSQEYYNYFTGNKTEHWAMNIHAYKKVILENLWIGIDLEIITEDEALKYNFIVHPGANPAKIKWKYVGAQKINMIEDGSIDINTTLTGIIENAPVSYSLIGAKKKRVSSSYKMQNNDVGFVVGKYNTSTDLVIDPYVIFATYSGSKSHNYGFTATYDHLGFTYSGGTAFDGNFPTTTGAFQTTYGGGFTDGNKEIYGHDCAILKYNLDGTKLLWASYLGGSNNEQPHSMVIDKKGNLVILGTTFSKDFPITANGFDSSYNGNGDIFITSISKDGNSINSSTFFGGSDQDGLNGPADTFPNGKLFYNYGDRYRGEVITDSDGYLVIASCTRSTDFTTKNAFQNSLGGMQDGCVLKMSSDLSTLIWSSYLGGDDEDAAYALNFDRKGNYFICGGTFSTNLKTSGGRTKTKQGKRDGFIYKIDKDGNFVNATYHGTKEYDQNFLIQPDENDNIYVYSQSEGSMPVVGNVYNNKNGKQFISVFDNNLKTLLLSSNIGSGRSLPELSPCAFLVDLCGRVCLSGWGGPSMHYILHDSSTVRGLPITPDAYQNGTIDGADFYLMILSRGMKSLVYATYLGGGQSEEHVDGGTSRFDRNGIIYQSVCAGCGGHSDFPTTKGAWSSTNNGIRPDGKGGCNNAVFKMSLASSNFPPKAKDSVFILTAGDTLNYSFSVNDSDKNDSVFITLKSDIFDTSKIKNPLAVFKGSKGDSNLKCNLYWRTNCKHISTDTYMVYLNYRDDGCPIPNTSTSIIKIFVKEPPPPKAPALFCLKPSGANTLKIEWENIVKSKYPAKYFLVKKFPNGTTQVLSVFSGNLPSGNFYTDANATNFVSNDYRYFIYSVNNCGKIIDTSVAVSSIPAKDSLPAIVYLKTVSVEHNKSLRIEWNQYPKADFKMYILQKKKNVAGENYSSLKVFLNSIDTSFLDSVVEVNKYSYCYRIYALNACGLTSNISNDGCSILLKGNAEPFINYLSWSRYQTWNGGVKNYEIYRQEDEDFFKLGATDSANKTLTDSLLNYDWGLYHYKVIAHEGVGSINAISVSNEIVLLQKPIAYMPNVFRPNGTINDTFKTVHAFVKDFHLRIFTRWGERVFDSYDKHIGWDGTYLGNKPFLNNLIWQIEYTGWDKQTYYKQGNITSIK